MAAGGDVAQLVHYQTQFTQNVLNVYYFEAVTGGADLADLSAWFATNVVPAVKASQNTSVAHVKLELKNLFDNGEVDDLALSGTGDKTATGQTIPEFLAASIRLLHNNGFVRSGWKRVCCGTEDEINGSAWDAALVADVEDIADFLINPLSPTLTDWVHVVLQRVRVVDPVTGVVTYELPTAQGQSEIGYPTSYVVSNRVTTQNSRKWYT